MVCVVLGVFENYLCIKIIDTTIMDANSQPKILAASDWFHFHDLASTKISTQQSWEFLAYMPISFIGIHKLFALPSKSKLEYPKSEYDNYLAQKEREGILSSFVLGLNGEIIGKFGWSKSRMATETLGYLLRILSPSIRSVRLGEFYFIFSFFGLVYISNPTFSNFDFTPLFLSLTHLSFLQIFGYFPLRRIFTFLNRLKR